MTVTRKLTRVALLVVAFASALGLSLRAQPQPPTAARLRAFENVKKLESKMVLDHDEYVPRETALLTVTIRNPTNQPLAIPAPFHQLTGGCYLQQRRAQFAASPDPGLDDEYWGSMGEGANLDLRGPIVVIGPGKEITGTVLLGGVAPTVAWAAGGIPRSPAGYRLRYSYDPRMYADFRVVAVKRVLAVSLAQLREEDVLDESSRKIVRGRSSVPFIAAETSNGRYLLFRAPPRCCRPYFDASPDSYGTALFEFIYGFERVGVLEEEVTSLRTELRADDTVDVIAETISHRQLVLHAPARPRTIPAAR